MSAFDDIYATRAWNPEGTKSGPGSSDEATQGLRTTLPGLMRMLNVTSVLDAACGEALWMPPLPGYMGCDIVPEAIETARLAHPDRTFFVADVVDDALPLADLIICRDAMMHMTLFQAERALRNFARSSRWLLATTFLEGQNIRIVEGSFFHINLAASPFEMKPVMLLPDTWRFPDKRLALYELR